MSTAPRKRKGSVTFSPGTSGDVQTATSTVVDVLGQAFSPGHHSINVRETRSGSSYAVTTPTNQGKTSSIRINPGRHRGSGDERIGRMTQTMLHEIGLHSVPVLGHRAGINPRTSERQDHQAMYMSDRRESFLEKSRQTFLALSNAEQKRGFANEWRRDVNDHVAMDRRSTTHDERQEVRQWTRARRDSMVDAITRPERHSWTPQAPLLVFDEPSSPSGGQQPSQSGLTSPSPQQRQPRSQPLSIDELLGLSTPSTPPQPTPPQSQPSLLDELFGGPSTQPRRDTTPVMSFTPPVQDVSQQQRSQVSSTPRPSISGSPQQRTSHSSSDPFASIGAAVDKLMSEM